MTLPRALRMGLLGLLTAGVPVAGQVTEYAHVGMDSGRSTTVAVVAARLPVGSSHDPSGLEGAAWLLAASLAAQANAALDPGHAVVSVEVDRWTTTFTLSTEPHDWRRAWSLLDRVLFADPPQSEAFELARRELAGRLAFEAGSPVVDFEREAIRLLAPPSHPWARPTRGTPPSISAITLSDLARLKQDRYDAGTSAVALVGTEIDHGLRAGPAPRAAAATSGAAWTVGERMTLTQEVTSAWLAISYPVSATVPRTELELMTSLVTDALEPQVPDPDRFSTSIRLIDAPGGPVITIEAVVSPEAADRTERYIKATVDRLSERPPEGELFLWARRRFRAARLLDQSVPENAAARISADLLRDGAPRDLREEIWDISPATAAGALSLLGEPRVFLLSPDLGGPEG